MSCDKYSFSPIIYQGSILTLCHVKLILEYYITYHRAFGLVECPREQRYLANKAGDSESVFKICRSSIISNFGCTLRKISKYKSKIIQHS